ncbi:hypothetical protein CMI41_01155 [Candidatus Pacearchaeota archaeon]|nr:hypothetical protein [Candidatus Pacearchaeota archaeon]|tara:strand:- start:6157 stop:6759 length:603 start_codon:yes stop_codon:yes gene_type:complete
MFKAYGVGFQERDFELVRKITKVITEEYVVIKDLRYYDINLEDTKDSIVFLFGSKASRLAKDISTRESIFLPEIKSLYQKEENESSRQSAFKKLMLLKDIIENKNTVDTVSETNLIDPVPDTDLKDLKILEQTLVQKNINKWISTTKNGKTIQISIQPEPSETDINITFAELYALRYAMDILNINEWMIVYSNKDIETKD